MLARRRQEVRGIGVFRKSLHPKFSNFQQTMQSSFLDSTGGIKNMINISCKAPELLLEIIKIFEKIIIFL